MLAIFGSTLATGRFALGSNEPLGVNNADSVAAKIKGEDFSCPALDARAKFEAKPKVEGKVKFEYGEGSKDTTCQHQCGGGVRGRGPTSVRIRC
jgi:hypothetical protein